MVQVHHDEGVANRIDPESCASTREGIGEALTGERIGQPLSRESTLILGADVVPVTEGNTDGRGNASAQTARRGLRHWHVRTLFVREPGDLMVGQRQHTCCTGPCVARYSQLDTADRQTAAGEEPSETGLLTKTRLRERLAKLEEEVKRLAAIEKALLASPDKQISLTDPDCRSMATSGRGSGMVAYNVQSAVDTTNHLIVAHKVTNVGTDRSQLATMAQAAKAALRSDSLDVVADRGYYKGEEILACEQAGVAVTLPKPQTSGAKSAGRFGKPDFVYLAKDDAYRCPAGEKLAHHFTAEDDGQKMRIYLTKACRTCPLKDQCTTSNERRIKRWEHEHVVEAAQTRLDQNPQAMRVRRETVEHPFATLKMRMGATHFLMKRLPNVATEMALNVLSYNLTRVLNIVGVKPLLAAMRA